MTQKKLSFNHLLSSDNLTKNDLKNIFILAKQYKNEFLQGKKEWDVLQGYILATLFFEPSTRTRLSFEAATIRLGGKVITVESGDSSALSKGESLFDTGKIISSYADFIVVRHPDIGSSQKIAKHSSSPVINGGDGANEHPTQSLLDLYTIFEYKKKLDNLTIAFVGDIQHSRTIHSLLHLLKLHNNNKFIFISSKNLAFSQEQKEKYLKNTGFVEYDNIQDGLKNADILYMTRIQKERFTKDQNMKKEYLDNCLLKKEHFEHSKDDLIVMHPLPKGKEISEELADYPQSVYFEQAKNGLFVRMALLSLLKN